jgi:hypothetical protein
MLIAGLATVVTKAAPPFVGCREIEFRISNFERRIKKKRAAAIS